MDIIDTVTRLLHKYGKIVFLILLFAVMGMQFFISTNMKACPDLIQIEKEGAVRDTTPFKAEKYDIVKIDIPRKVHSKLFKTVEYHVVKKIKTYKFKGVLLYWERSSNLPIVRPWVLLYDGRTEIYRKKLTDVIWFLVFIFCIAGGIIGEAGYATRKFCSYGQAFTIKTCGFLLGSIGLFLLLAFMVILIVY